MKNQKILIIVLCILLVIAAVFISATQIRAYSNQKLEVAFQQGGQIGYQQAILEVMQQLSTCNPVPLVAGNATINAVAVECLQQAE